jgi:MtrB/PioB family decaheme-associated outer membrane protein
MKRKGTLASRRAALFAGAMSIAAIPSTAALAADQQLITKAPWVGPAWAEPGWYFYGGLEAGGRWYIHQPPSGFGRAPPPDNWLTPLTTDSIQKFEEFGKIPRGVLLDWINLQTGSNDGRYAFDFWGRSVGLDNQSYTLDASAPGYHYLSLGWDQTPHLISTSAKTLFNGVGTTHLTVADPIQAALQAQMPFAALAAPPVANGIRGDVARTAMENIINSSVYNIELGTRRDKSSVGYKWTPSEEWTFAVDYSHEHRTGIRPLSINYGYSTGAFTPPNTINPAGGTLAPRPTNTVETPAPIDDKTQNINAGGEYFGTTFFGTKWNTNVSYVGSFYNNSDKSFTVENPFCLTCTDTVRSRDVGPNLLFMPMQPNNQANGVVWNTGINLPWFKSRYTSTFQFNHMTQDDAFPTNATNGVIPLPIRNLAGVPVYSLNGAVNTTLWNHVLTAYLTSDLKFVGKLRHYSNDNNTPMLLSTNYNWADSGLVTQNRVSLPIAYSKDNASTELNWRPVRWLNVGGGWLWERWDRKFRDANVTKENTERVYADITPTDWVLWRGSYTYAQRRYAEYDTEFFVCDASGLFPNNGCSEVASNMRRYDVANRNRRKAETALELAIVPAYLTITPNAGLRRDDYPEDDVFNPLGLRSDHGWSAGVEIAAMIQPTFKVMAAYTREDRHLFVTGGSGGANFNTGDVRTGCSTSLAINPEAIIGTLCTWQSDIHQRSNTFLLAADWKVVPNTFDLRFEYTYTRSYEQNDTTGCAAPLLVGTTAVGTNCNGFLTTGSPARLVDPSLLNFGQFPTEVNTFQRFNVIARYYVDPMLVRMMGWVGDVTLKVRYTWERNHMSNWAYDTLTPYLPASSPNEVEISGANRSLFLAAYNPNYNAQLIAGTVALKW